MSLNTIDNVEKGLKEEGSVPPQGLRRELSLYTATFLVVASMIGTGIFTTSGLIIDTLHDPKSMFICWVLGGVFALSGALCYGELGAMFPQAGGDYVFLRESFGSVMAFLSGWISLIVGFSAPIAAAAIAAGKYFFRLLPESLSQASHENLLESDILTISPLVLFAIFLILFFSLLHSYSLYAGSIVGNFLTLFKIIVILAFAAAGLFMGKGSVAHFAGNGEIGSVFTGGFASSLVFVSFAYSGWNTAAYLGGEIKDPSRNIPLALFYGTLLVTGLYLLLNFVFIYALSPEEMSGVIEIGAASAIALFGRPMGGYFSAAVMVCILSVISAMIMAGPRVYYAMAHDNVFFQVFSRVTKDHNIPLPAISLQAVIAIVMVMTASFDKLLLYVGFTLTLFSMFTVMGLVLLRRERPAAVRSYKTWGYPLTPIVFLAGNLWILFYFIQENPRISLYGAGTILSGLVFYLFFRSVIRDKA